MEINIAGIGILIFDEPYRLHEYPRKPYIGILDELFGERSYGVPYYNSPTIVDHPTKKDLIKLLLKLESMGIDIQNYTEENLSP